MISYFQNYVTVGAVLAFGMFFMLLLVGLASVLRPSKPYAEKLTTYECGVDPVGTGWSQTYVRYYIFGLLFVIFDVEAGRGIIPNLMKSCLGPLTAITSIAQHANPN